MYELQSCAKTL